MLNELWNLHRGRLIGTAAGLLFGFIYLFAGFWSMVVFALIVSIGYTLGSADNRRKLVLTGQKIYRFATDKWGIFK